MFWDKVAWIYDVFANVINRKADKKLCDTVKQLISPEDEVLECACGCRAFERCDCRQMQKPCCCRLFCKHAKTGKKEI